MSPMALRPCRECGFQISTEAKTCPHCGTPAPAATRTPISAGMGCLIIVGFLVLMVTLFDSSDSPSKPDPKEIQRQQDMVAAAIQNDSVEVAQALSMPP